MASFASEVNGARFLGSGQSENQIAVWEKIRSRVLPQ